MEINIAFFVIFQVRILKVYISFSTYKTLISLPVYAGFSNKERLITIKRGGETAFESASNPSV
jgi:hypothetical protein